MYYSYIINLLGINIIPYYVGTYTVHISPPNRSVEKSNSRVASAGRLRLRVESFRQNNGDTGMKEEDASKHAGHYKKHAAPPSKPVRKTKNATQSQQQQQQQQQGRGGGQDRSDRSTSPGDNSSTSGYSSPSAGPHSKESTPYGSKVEGGGERNDERQKEGEVGVDEEENRSKITVIQIVPATLNNGEPLPVNGVSGNANKANNNNNGSSVDEEEEADETEEEEDVPESAVQAQIMRNNLQRFQQLERNLAAQEARKRSSSPPHRELPKVQQQQQQPPKRRLPEARGPPPSHLLQQYLPQFDSSRMGANTANSHHQLNNNSKPFLAPRGPVGRRIFRSTAAPRPAPMPRPFAPPPPSASSSSGPGSFLPQHVPLPPVPELERSDQERESISPSPGPPPPTTAPPPPPTTTALPQDRSAKEGGYQIPKPRSPTRPLTSNPVLSSAQQPRAATRSRHQQEPSAAPSHYQRPAAPSRLPVATRSSLTQDHLRSKQQPAATRPEESSRGRGDQEEEEEEMEAKLRALLALLNRGGGEERKRQQQQQQVHQQHQQDEQHLLPQGTDTLQYLSQLEEMARRLKDQLLMEQPQVGARASDVKLS